MGDATAIFSIHDQKDIEIHEVVQQVYDALKEKGYNMNDVIGISGLESVYEDELRGKDGVETITRNSDGVIVDLSLIHI